MKTIGLIGGMSWESTSEYYKLINQEVKKILGGLHSAKIILYSVDFDEIEKLQVEQEWTKSGEILGEKASVLEKAGADFILIASNTMHKVFPQIEKAVTIPLLHILEPVIIKLREDKINKILLLGTKYTMEQDFFKDKYKENGIEVIIPNPEEIEVVNNIIYDELCLGKFLTSSEQMLINIINKEIDQDNIQAVVLGCTELELLLQQEQVKLPLFKTSFLHTKYAAQKACE